MKILVAGDFSPRYGLKKLFDKGEYGSVFGAVKPIIDNADWSIVGLETTLAGENDRPVQKCGPNLCCDENALKAVKWAGFDMVTMANNHIADYGSSAVIRTIECLKSEGLEYVGAGETLARAQKTYYKSFGDKVLAIINCCEHEFSIATDAAAGANPLDPISQYYAIKEATGSADFVLVIVHGGHEHFQLPSPRMQDTYRFFIDAGADAVVNFHQHCYSGMEIYHDKPIFYGLGNFCFDNATRLEKSWYEGLMVELDFQEKVSYRLLPYTQCESDTAPCVQPLPEGNFKAIFDELSAIISDRNALTEAVKAYYQSDSRFIMSAFTPYENRYLAAAYRRGLLPSLISRKKLLRLSNYLHCESHLDKVRFAVEMKRK